MKPPKRIKYLSDAEVNLLEQSIDQKRDKLLLETLYETGCTINEAVQLRISDIDTAHRRINFSADITKSKKQKSSLISNSLNSKITDLLEEKSIQRIKSNYLFSTRQSKRMTTKRARQLFSHYGVKAGLGKILPQMIRYAHVIHAVERGISLNAVKRQTGLDKTRLVHICDAISKPETEDPYKRFFEKQTSPDEKRNLTDE